MKRLVTGVSALVLVATLAATMLVAYQRGAGANPAYFESAIVAFEEEDALGMPPPGGILFVGSSSIRFWTTLAEDMAPLPIVRRGFGGAHMTHVVYNFDRIVTPYAPRAVVVFVGGNDIGSGKSAERVTADFRVFLDRMRSELPDTDVWLLSMKPSKLRWDQWSEMKRVDEILVGLAEVDPSVRFVETGATLLGPDGTPDDVYVFDGLHLNGEGYRRWTSMLKPMLMQAYGQG